MKFQFKFKRILQLKEREKDQAHSLYEQSIQKFEATAQKLYELLKEKEELEQFQTNELATGFSVQKIRHHQQYIDHLAIVIDKWHKRVIHARNEMAKQQRNVQAKNIEVKKYEKMKDKNYEIYRYSMNANENALLDEIAGIQYYHRKGN